MAFPPLVSNHSGQQNKYNLPSVYSIDVGVNYGGIECKVKIFSVKY